MSYNLKHKAKKIFSSLGFFSVNKPNNVTQFLFNVLKNYLKNKILN